MLDILFGWRKASKCKNLVKHVQCRLKFLKIKRESSIRQVRDHVARLIENGDNENAFSRVEQLFKDQNLLAAYDLLDHFCEFIIINFPYIRKHKDCPNDINEAVSTMIYAAAWCGDLPELQKIKKLFGERYGRRFAKAAVELHPGTLVNCQIRETLCIKPIPDTIKLKLMDEIAKDCTLQQELFGCDNSVKLHAPKLCGTSDHQWEEHAVKGEAQVITNRFRGAQMPASYTIGELSEMSSNSNPRKQIVELPRVNAMDRRSVQAENPVQFECSNEPKRIRSMLAGQNRLESCSSNKFSPLSSENVVEMGSTKPASEISFQFHKSVINFEEVMEFQFGPLQDLCGEDKRTFLFNSSILQVGQGYRFGGESLLFSSRHVFDKNGNDKNMIFGRNYGDFHQKLSGQLGHRSKHLGNMPTQVGENSLFGCNEKLWSPRHLHYLRMNQKHICCYKMQQHILSSKCEFDNRKSYCICRFSCDMDVNCSLEHPCYHSVMEESGHGENASYSRTKTLSPKKIRGTAIGNNFQSASSRLQHLKRSMSSSHSHVHPKLPDYDELAAKFMALKKEHQQRTSAEQEKLPH